MNVVDLDRRAALSTAALVDSTSPSQYEAPTPCTDWTVRDLLRATGQPAPWSSEVVDACLDQFRSWLPAQRPPGSAFADATAVSPHASPIDRLAAYLGRDVEAWSI